MTLTHQYVAQCAVPATELFSPSGLGLLILILFGWSYAEGNAQRRRHV